MLGGDPAAAPEVLADHVVDGDHVVADLAGRRTPAFQRSKAEGLVRAAASAREATGILRPGGRRRRRGAQAAIVSGRWRIGAVLLLVGRGAGGVRRRVVDVAALAGVDVLQGADLVGAEHAPLQHGDVEALAGLDVAAHQAARVEAGVTRRGRPWGRAVAGDRLFPHHEPVLRRCTGRSRCPAARSRRPSWWTSRCRRACAAARRRTWRCRALELARLEELQRPRPLISRRRASAPPRGSASCGRSRPRRCGLSIDCLSRP
jgi:hypothetical protein